MRSLGHDDGRSGCEAGTGDLNVAAGKDAGLHADQVMVARPRHHLDAVAAPGQRQQRGNGNGEHMVDRLDCQ